MKNKVLAVCLTLFLTGCSSIDSFNNSIGSALHIDDRTTASTVGGGIAGTAAGCVVGALSGSIARGCLAGAAIGAAGGYAISVSEQLEEAKKLQQEINQQNIKGMTSTVKSSPVTNKEDSTTVSQDRKLDEMVINIPKDKVYDESVSRVLVKAAKISSASKKDVTITVYGPEKESTYMMNILRQNSGNQVKINKVVSTKTLIKITPIPEV